MARFCFFTLLLVAFAIPCQGRNIATVATEFRDDTLQMVMSFWRGGNATALIQTARAEEEGSIGPFVGFMIAWIIGATLVVTLNTWQEKPRFGVLSALGFLLCPGCLFALCLPVDGPSTSCGGEDADEEKPAAAAERRPLLGHGNTTSILLEEEGEYTRIFHSCWSLIYLGIMAYAAYAGFAGVSGGCAPVLSEILILKAVLLFAIIGLQAYLHSLIKDDFHQQTIGGWLVIRKLELPDDPEVHAKLRHIMQFQQMLFIISVGATMGMWSTAPTITVDPDADDCANGVTQSGAAGFFIWQWFAVAITYIVFYTQGQKDLEGMRDWFLHTAHLWPL